MEDPAPTPRLRSPGPGAPRSSRLLSPRPSPLTSLRIFFFYTTKHHPVQSPYKSVTCKKRGELKCHVEKSVLGRKERLLPVPRFPRHVSPGDILRTPGVGAAGVLPAAARSVEAARDAT